MLEGLRARAPAGTSFALLLQLAAPALASECRIQRVDVPVTMVGRQPMLTAQINGAPAVFIIDSGGFWSTLTVAAAEQYQLHPDSDKLPGFSIKGINGSTAVKVARVDDFTIFNAAVHKVDFIVGGTDFGVGTAGTLGQNLLRIADIEYDLAQGAVRFMKPTDCKNSPLAYWAKPGEPYSMMEIRTATALDPHTAGVAYLNGAKIRVAFNTGSSTSIIGLFAAARAGIKPGGPGVEPGEDAVGFGLQSVKTWVATFSTLKVGDEEVRNARLPFGDIGDFDLLLGADFFFSHRVYVASSQSRLYFTYNGGPVFNLAAAKAHANEAAKPPADLDTTAPGIALRAAAYFARHDLEHALQDYDRACELAPNEATYFYARGSVKLGLGRNQEGVEDIEHALRLNPDYAEARMTRAELQLKTGAKTEALKNLDAVDRLATKQANLRYTLAVLYSHAEQWQASIAQLDLWIDSHPEDANLPDALNDRCWAQAVLGRQLYPALEDCDRALRYMPHSAALLDSRGFVQLRRKEFKRAIADYDAVLKLDPKAAWSLYCRGLAKSRLGKSQEGAADMAAAVAQDPGVTERAKHYGIE